MEVTFTAWNAPVTAGFARAGQAQPGKPGNGKSLLQFKSTGWSILLLFSQATEDYSLLETPLPTHSGPCTV